MALEALRIVKSWFTNVRTVEHHWDEIADNIVSKSVRDNNNFKQLGLDIGGSNYDFNNVGKSTQTIPLITRIGTLEAQSGVIGTGNLGLDLSTPSVVVIRGSNGSALSASNIGQVSFNSTSNPGQVVTYNLTANLSVTLTGAHWGFDGGGDLTDFPLWLMLLDTGSSVVLGVAAQGGRSAITTADDETAVGNVTTFSKVLVSSALSGTCNASYLGWIKADFDDTGNAGGENFWTLQSSTSDVNLGPVEVLFFGEVRA